LALSILINVVFRVAGTALGELASSEAIAERGALSFEEGGTVVAGGASIFEVVLGLADGTRRLGSGGTGLFFLVKVLGSHVTLHAFGGLVFSSLGGEVTFEAVAGNALGSTGSIHLGGQAALEKATAIAVVLFGVTDSSDLALEAFLRGSGGVRSTREVTLNSLSGHTVCRKV
jgi:hypothetical protein